MHRADRLRVHMLVSTIIIFLNPGPFLEEAIQSVFAQSYDRWELLLVDDGSTDESTAVARSYAERFPERVRYLEHEGHRNLGMSASRNLGMLRSSGDCIAFLDADDVWLPGKLTEQVSILNAWPEAGAVCGATEIWYSWSEPEANGSSDHVIRLLDEPDLEEASNGTGGKLVHPPDLLKCLYPLGAGYSMSTSNYLVRRSVFEGVGGFEERFRGLFEDQVFQVKLYCSVPIFISDRCWDRYRQHGASCMATMQGRVEQHELSLQFMEWLEGYLASSGVLDRELVKLLRRKRWHAADSHLPRLVARLERAIPGVQPNSIADLLTRFMR